MEIGECIKKLRQYKRMTQEEMAELLKVSVQTVSRWENNLNYPDLIMLPELASLFHVTTDYLLGVKGEPKMAKLLMTKETFQVSSRTEAENMVRDFQNAVFPRLLAYNITEENGDIILIVEKEFGEEFDKMKFKSQTTTSSGGLEEPCKGDCVLPFKGGCYKPVTCPPIRNALLAYYWLPYKGHFLVISLFGLFLLLFNISLHCCFIYIAYCFHIIPSCPKFFISSSPEFGMPVKYL